MTPEERADKIIERLREYDNVGITRLVVPITALRDICVAQIREAVEEEAVKIANATISEAVKEAAAEAYEDAAKIAELHITNRTSGGIWQEGYDHAVMEITANLRARLGELK